MNCPENVWSKMTSSNEVSRSVRQAGKRSKEAPVTAPLCTHQQHPHRAFQPPFQMCSAQEDGRRNLRDSCLRRTQLARLRERGSAPGASEPFELDKPGDSRWGWSRGRWGLGEAFLCPFLRVVRHSDRKSSCCRAQVQKTRSPRTVLVRPDAHSAPRVHPYVEFVLRGLFTCVSVCHASRGRGSTWTRHTQFGAGEGAGLRAPRRQSGSVRPRVWMQSVRSAANYWTQSQTSQKQPLEAPPTHTHTFLF